MTKKLTFLMKNQMNSRLDICERTKAVRLYSEIKSYKHTEREWSKRYSKPAPSYNTIKSINQKFNLTGSVQDMEGRG